MKLTHTLTKEKFNQKCNRVEKELNSMIKKYATIPSLTEDQRYILISDFGNEESVYHTFKIGGNLYMDDILNSFNPINNQKYFIKVINDTLNKCVEFASKNKLVYVSYGFDDYGGYGAEHLAVSGYKMKSDKELIDKYMTRYLKEKQERKDKSKKIITVNNKKYKLVEYKYCDCECGCDCWNGHCDCGCVECT